MVDCMCETCDDMTRFWLGEVYVVFTKGKFSDVSERCESMRELECVCLCFCLCCRCIVEGDIQYTELCTSKYDLSEFWIDSWYDDMAYELSDVRVIG